MKKGAEAPFFNDLQTPVEVCGSKFGAGDESRTRDLNLGKVALYQLSYSRIVLHLQRFAVQHAARKIWSGRRVSNSRPQPWQGCALPTELLPRIAALPLPRHTLTSSCSGEARLCRRHIRVSRAFPALFTKTCSTGPITRRRARESAAMRASCSTASTRSSAPRQDTSAIRPTHACRSSRYRAAAERRTAASELRPFGMQS